MAGNGLLFKRMPPGSEIGDYRYILWNWDVHGGARSP